MNTQPLRHNKRFIQLVIIFLLDNMGTWFDFLALQILFTNLWHASGFMLSLVFAAFMLPIALFSQFTGTLIDRFNIPKILSLATFLAGAATLLLLYCHQPWQVISLVFIRSSLLSLCPSGQQALIKFIVVDENLLKASGIVGMIRQSSKIIAPLAGAVLLSFSSPWACIKINLISFIICSLIFLTIKVEQSNKTHSSTMLQDTVLGWKLLIENKRFMYNLSWLLIALTLIMFAAVEMAMLLKHYRPHQHAILGIITAASGIGSALSASWLAKSKKNSMNYFGATCLAMAFVAISYFLYGYFNPHWNTTVLYTAALIEGLGFGITMVTYSYMIKRESPAEHAGKIIGACSSLQCTLTMLGAIGGGWLVDTIGVVDTFRAVAFCLGLVCSIMLIKYSTMLLTKPSYPA